MADLVLDKWPEIIDYCKNDVLACEEAVAEIAENNKKGEQDGGRDIT